MLHGELLDKAPDVFPSEVHATMDLFRMMFAVSDEESYYHEGGRGPGLMAAARRSMRESLRMADS